MNAILNGARATLALVIVTTFGFAAATGDLPTWRLLLAVAAIPWLFVLYSAAQRRQGQVMADSAEPIDNIRLIPVYRHQFVDGVDRRDLRHFIIDSMRTQDWTQRRWRGRRMPSGRRCDNEYHHQMLEILRRTGVLVNSGPRRTGYLATHNITEVLERLGLDT